jgi:transcriptional regulator with XRE-family HTH domain
MTEIAHSIDLNLPQKLRDKAYRRKFFWAESCADIAKQLVDLRKRRGLNQKQVAEMTGTKQSAISRFEQADYQNRNLNTLHSIADELDARVRVLIEPYEDILKEYDDEAVDTADTDEVAETDDDISGNVVSAPLQACVVDAVYATGGGAGTAAIPVQLSLAAAGSANYVIKYAFQGTAPYTKALLEFNAACNIANPAIAQANILTPMYKPDGGTLGTSLILMSQR